MSAIAEILLAKGFQVQGSDQKLSSNVRRLLDKGVQVFIGHDPKNLVNAQNIILSSAVKITNPEFAEARNRGLPIISRADILAELMRLYSTVSVTGTHGKTTTTSLIATIFEKASLDPTVITGGIINSWGSNARLGRGPWMVVEADESDGTFVRLPTQIGVVTNIDPEHLDFFKTVDEMHKAFETFYRRIPFYGVAVTCIDHPVVRDMIERINPRKDGRRLLTYGTSVDADFRLTSCSQNGFVTSFDAVVSARVKGGGRHLKGWSVPVPGLHNALNALAAVAVASEAGIPDDLARLALEQFSGVKRRFQLTGQWNGIPVYDDYGHHPTEIAAVLSAAKAGAKGRVIAVVEPHRYSRVRDLFSEFSTCFSKADVVIVGPLYTAGEQSIEGIDHHTLAESIRAQGHPSVRSIDSPEDLAPVLRSYCVSGDMIVCFGAGNSTEWAGMLPRWLSSVAAE